MKEYKLPITINADNFNAFDEFAASCQVYDVSSFLIIGAALEKAKLHVLAWDADGMEILCYDNR